MTLVQTHGLTMGEVNGLLGWRPFKGRHMRVHFLLFVSWLQRKDYREADLETEGELQILGLEVLETFREI